MHTDITMILGMEDLTCTVTHLEATQHIIENVSWENCAIACANLSCGALSYQHDVMRCEISAARRLVYSNQHKCDGSADIFIATRELYQSATYDVVNVSHRVH